MPMRLSIVFTRYDVRLCPCRRGSEVLSVGPLGHQKPSSRRRCLFNSHGRQVAASLMPRHVCRQGDDLRDGVHADRVRNASRYQTPTHPSDASGQRRRWCHPVTHGGDSSSRVVDPEVVKRKVESGAFSHVDDRYVSRADIRSRLHYMRHSLPGRKVSRACF